jgi:hypothetical protein
MSYPRKEQMDKKNTVIIVKREAETQLFDVSSPETNYILNNNYKLQLQVYFLITTSMYMKKVRRSLSKHLILKKISNQGQNK